MFVNVSGILKNYGERIDFDSDVELGSVDFLGETYLFLKPVAVKGSITNNGQALEMKADACAEISLCCARCRKEITRTMNFSIEEIFIREEEAENIDTDDVMVFSGYNIELDNVVLNNFLISTEGKYLCSDDCKGLCPKCGKDLNEGSCECEEDVDPRWEELLRIMNKNRNE